jgi:hypothetical protein
MAGGQEITGEQGSFGNSGTVRLRSRKNADGTAGTTLSGLSASALQGALGNTRSKPLVGSVIQSIAGTVTAPSSSDADADWLARSTADGVFRTFHFNDSSQLGPNSASGPWQTADWFHQSGTSTVPTISTEQKCSGAASLMFEIPTNTDANAGGNFQAHFGTVGDLRLVGEGDEIFISYRCRWNAAMATITAQNQGTKYGGIEVARRESYTGGSFEWNGSGENWAGITIQTLGTSRVPHHYTLAFRRDENPSVLEGPAAQLLTTYPDYPGTDLGIQNSYPSGPCLYAGSLVAGQEATECWLMPTDEWVTFKYHLQVLSRRSASPYNNEFWDISFKFYAARQGEDFALLHEWSDAYPGYGPTYNGPVAQGSADTKFGKFRLMPYITGKSTGVAHATGKVWCDEVIFSSQDIPAPGFSLYPAWRQGLTPLTLTALTGTQKFNNAAGDLADIINAWAAFANDGTYVYSAAGSGHASWWNPVYRLNLDQDVPEWESLDFGSDVSDIVEQVPYYEDGRPTGRHNYYSCVYTNAGGVPRIVLPTCDANYSLAGNSSETSVDAYRLDGYTGGPAGTAWEVTGSGPSSWVSLWQNNPDITNLSSPAVAVHPTTGMIYVMGAETGNDGATRAFRILDPTTKTWGSKQKLTPAYPDAGISPVWTNIGSVIDVGRNLWVSLNPYNAFNGSFITPRLVRINLSTLAVTQITLSGDIPPSSYAMSLTHNTDDGFYYVLSSASTPVTKIYKIDPDSGASTLIFSTTTAAECVIAGNAAQSRFTYLSWLRGMVWAPRWDSPVYFFPIT